MIITPLKHYKRATGVAHVQQVATGKEWLIDKTTGEVITVLVESYDDYIKDDTEREAIV